MNDLDEFKWEMRPPVYQGMFERATANIDVYRKLIQDCSKPLMAVRCEIPVGHLFLAADPELVEAEHGKGMWGSDVYLFRDAGVDSEPTAGFHMGHVAISGIPGPLMLQRMLRVTVMCWYWELHEIIVAREFRRKPKPTTEDESVEQQMEYVDAFASAGIEGHLDIENNDGEFFPEIVDDEWLGQYGWNFRTNRALHHMETDDLRMIQEGMKQLFMDLQPTKQRIFKYLKHQPHY